MGLKGWLFRKLTGMSENRYKFIKTASDIEKEDKNESSLLPLQQVGEETEGTVDTDGDAKPEGNGDKDSEGD